MTQGDGKEMARIQSNEDLVRSMAALGLDVQRMYIEDNDLIVHVTSSDAIDFDDRIKNAEELVFFLPVGMDLEIIRETK